MVKASNDDTLPPHPWVGPNGLLKKNTNRVDRRYYGKYQGYRDTDNPHRFQAPYDPREFEAKRKDYLLNKDMPYGALIGRIEEDKRILISNSSSTFLIGKMAEHKANCSGILWLAVNEIWLGEEKKAAYLDVPITTKSNPSACCEQQEPSIPRPYSEAAWFDRIVENNYWNMWFDDNSGAFFVVIEIKTHDETNDKTHD